MQACEPESAQPRRGALMRMETRAHSSYDQSQARCSRNSWFFTFQNEYIKKNIIWTFFYMCQSTHGDLCTNKWGVYVHNQGIGNRESGINIIIYHFTHLIPQLCT